MHAGSRRRFLVQCGAWGAAIFAGPNRGWSDGAGWRDYCSAGSLVCRAEFSLEPYRTLIEEVASLEAELSETLAVGPARETIEIYLLRDQDAHRRYLERHLPRVPYRRALFVKSGGQGMVFAYQHPELDVDLRHESTHAFLHAALPMVPLWLDEGLAEYFEVPKQDRAYENPHLASLKWNLRLGMVPRLSKLESRHRLAEMGRQEYRFAWAWVHFMLHGPDEARAELVAYLGDIRAGAAPGVLSDRLASRLPDAENRLVEHFKHWKR